MLGILPGPHSDPPFVRLEIPVVDVEKIAILEISGKDVVVVIRDYLLHPGLTAGNR